MSEQSVSITRRILQENSDAWRAGFDADVITSSVLNSALATHEPGSII